MVDFDKVGQLAWMGSFVEDKILLDRIGRWQQKLLDLSLKNPLLSLRANAGLGVWSTHPWSLAQAMSDEAARALRFFPLPISECGGVVAALWKTDPQLAKQLGAPALVSSETPVPVLAHESGVADILEQQMTSETHTKTGRRRMTCSQSSAEDQLWLERVEHHFKSQHAGTATAASSTCVVVDCDPETLQDQLARLERTNRLREDEAGVHVLFLAVGIVHWDDGSQSRKKAPLLLVPVSLYREHARDPFMLQAHDDDTVLNPALENMLAQQRAVDWTRVNELMSADRVDILAVVRAAKHALEGVADIEDDIRLCLLSYAKHHMWNDLDSRADKLMIHPVVRQIVGDRPTNSQTTLPVAWEEIDQQFAPDDLFLPLPADASQVRAIARVDHGESLVIQGPPGTGKSQTIANMISHLLASGKRVLFVAEKLTALGVVHDRLNQLGLGPFCLELHTQSSSKTRVLQQLQEALAARNTPAVQGYHEAAVSLQNMRRELNDSLEALHDTYPNGLSIYYAIGRIAQINQAPIIPGLIFQDILQESVDVVAARKQAATRYAQALRLKVPASAAFDAWRGAQLPDDTRLWGDLHALSEHIQHCQRLVRGWPQFAAHHHDGVSIEQWQQWLAVAQHWMDGKEISGPWKLRSLHGELVDDLLEFEHWNKKWIEAWNPHHHALNRSVLRETPQLWKEFLDIDQQWAGARWLHMRQWRQKVRQHEKEGCSEQDWRNWARAAEQVQEVYAKVEAAAKTIKDGTPKEAQKSVAAWSFSELVAWNQTVAQWSARLLELLETANSSALRDLCHEAARSRDDALIPRSWHMLDDAGWSALRTPWEALDALLHQYEYLLGMQDWTHLTLDDIDGSLNPLLSAQAAWTSWKSTEQYRQQALDFRLGAMVDAVETGRCPWDQVENSMDLTYATAFVNAARMSNPQWVSYQGAQRELAIKKFQEESDRFETLTRRQVVAQMAERLRDVPIDEWTDMVVLKREMMKKTRHLATRKLIHKMPKLLPVLKPCLMMSPLSVAEYLSGDVPDFDVVIFDEASQIPTADAIGALSRAKQVIVVGDPKQMPPSRLFSGDDDIEEYGEHIDLDSILTECLGSGMKSVLLNWHYRSRHEQLIAFSNKTYYGGNLITFPSPDVEGGAHKGLVVHDVNGLYDRGGSGTNMDEALAVVNALVKHIEGPHIHQSVGVVTFNQKQQTLIEQLWDKMLVQRPDLEERVTKLPQPISIKNLESVQGDERDVIFFSTTFGKDAQGRFLLNFGPLGQLGGERRLNVAITRARDRMEIFSSFHPNDIDPSRITHQGVIDMRHWLLFARTGTLDGGQASSSPTHHLPDSPFELAVLHDLVRNGWTVHPQVGCSGYRIDLAVLDPQHPHRYLAGIECDGATYHSFKTARDRDKQRQSILEGLGWTIERIWSTDWFEDRQREMQRIHERLLALQSQQHP